MASLEQQLNTNDQNIVQAFQNYMAARALVRNARSNLFPTVSIGATASRQGIRPASTARASNSISLSSYSLPLEVSWEPNLFGKVRNTITQYASAAPASASTLANERLSEQASLAQFLFELRGADALQQVYDSTVKSDEQTLELTRTLVETGLDSPQDVAQAETNLRAAQANATVVGVSRAQYEHAIALLVGQPASTFSIEVNPLKATPPAAPLGLPSQLLERWPDIAAAERTMAEANALIGVGKAAYYPSVTLTASAGTQANTLSNLLTWPARFWSLGGTVSETVLDFGARRATVQQYEADYNADVAASYLNVLTAQNALLSDQLSQVNTHVSQMTSSVQLIAALGGGWSTAQRPSEKAMHERPRNHAASAEACAG